ncbi:magnesium-dependent phosphatase-1 [Thermogladius sp. 4427co]|uniref:magnesium-dependent phosphatase-1 n=1 Tax=Thermogladius sp. 4427co TaxID=3450718 RepID=UPI003F78F533
MGLVGVKLVFVDLDLTLWDHVDASSLKPPFVNQGVDCVVDSSGGRLCLYPCAREFLAYLRSKGVIVSSLSWNNPVIVEGIMRGLGIYEYFDYHGIENTPDKHIIALGILKRVVVEKGIIIEPGEIVLIDDNESYYRMLSESIGGVRYLKPGRDFRDFCELINWFRQYG